MNIDIVIQVFISVIRSLSFSAIILIALLLSAYIFGQLISGTLLQQIIAFIIVIVVGFGICFVIDYKNKVQSNNTYIDVVYNKQINYKEVR